MAEKTLTRDGLPLVTRADASFRRNSFDGEAYTIVVSLGTGAPVQRWDYAERRGYIEVLSMAPDAIRLGRMNSGALFLVDHASYSVESTIGAFVPDSVRVENGELIGVVKLSKSERAADTVRDIIDGVLTSTSVGYLVHSWEITENADGTGTRTAVDWEPYEGSIVVVPADVTGGVRSAAVADHNSPMEGVKMGEVKENAVNEQAARDAEIKAAAEKAVKDYADRCADIRAAGRKMGLEQDQIEGMVENRALTADSAIRAMLDLRAAKDAEKPTNCRVDVTTDEREKRSGLMAAELAARAGVGTVNPDARREFGAKKLLDMARESIGVDARGMTDSEVAGRVIHSRMTSADFPYILANVANKVLQTPSPMMAGYRWFERVFSRQDFPDFKQGMVPSANRIGVLPQVLEGADYTEGSNDDTRETWDILKYGYDFPLTMEMLLNDDLSAFTAMPQEIADAAIRTQSALCAALLTGNQTMVADSKALFHNDHANLSTSAGVPTVTRLNELWKLLLAATHDGVAVGVPGTFLLFPASLQPTIENLYATPRVMPDYTTEALIAGIPAENRLVVPSMTGAAYFMATGRASAAKYGYLRSDGGLVVEQYPVEKADKAVFHARLAFACHVMKYQDFASNAGA